MPNYKKPRQNCLHCGCECSRSTYIYCSNICQQQYQKNKVKDDWYNNGNAPGWKYIKTILFEDRGNRCEVCGISEWNGKSLSLEIDHIDGLHTNNNSNNLRIICPNCHSQTDTYKAKNMGNGRASRRAS